MNAMVTPRRMSSESSRCDSFLRSLPRPLLRRGHRDHCRISHSILRSVCIRRASFTLRRCGPNRRFVFRLVQSDPPSAGQHELRDRSPPLLVHTAATYSFCRQLRNLGVEIVAQQVKFVSAILFGRVNSRLSGRQCKNQPTMPCVHCSKLKHISEERPALTAERARSRAR